MKSTINTNIVFLISLTMMCTGSIKGQFRTIQGILGGEYEKQSYTYPTTSNQLSRYHQIFSVNAVGYVYHPNVAEFNVKSSFTNINSYSVGNLGMQTDQRDTYFNYFDVSIDAFRATATPMSLYAKQDITKNESSNKFLPRFYNEILSTNKGGRVSVQAWNKAPRISLGYDDYSSKGLNPLVPIDTKTTNYQVALDGAFGKVMTWEVDARQRNQFDNINQLQYSTHEAHIRGSSQLNQKNQLSTNINYLKEKFFTTAGVQTLWNTRFTEDCNNQVTAQFQQYSYADTKNNKFDISDQFNMPLTQEWRGVASITHMEATATPRRSSTMTLGVNNEHEFEFAESNTHSQVSFQRVEYATLYHSLEGMISTGLRVKNIPFGTVTLGEQVNVRRSVGQIRQTYLNNSSSVTVESFAVQYCVLRANATYLIVKNLDQVTPSIRDLTMYFDATYRLIYGIHMIVNMNVAVNAMSSENYENTTKRYSATFSLPEMLPRVNLQCRGSLLNDKVRNSNEVSYDGGVTYNLRAIAFSIRFVGYAYSLFTRKDVYFTISRPFNFDFIQ